MATYFHVAPNSYNEGEDLLSWDAYTERYGETPGEWKWDGAEPGMIDGDTVSLFREDQLDEARDFARSWISGTAKFLTIDDADGTLDVTVNREGYASVERLVPGHLISRVEMVAKPRRQPAPMRPNPKTCSHANLGPLMDLATGHESANQADERAGTFRVCADCGSWRRYS